MLTVCLLRPLSALVRLPRPAEPRNETAIRRSHSQALGVAEFLYQHIYGRSRVPPLTVLLQREFQPTPPLPFRRDSLLISRPGWFEPRIRLLQEVCHLHEALERVRNAQRALQELRAALLAAQQGQQPR